jgi:N-acetyl-alpha-D-glucosaminyl L-malate synthase BshA
MASASAEALAARGHEVHFISYGRPFRLPADEPRIHFHPVEVNTYDLFKYPDYTLPLSVKMAEVAAEFSLDVLHVHYAVPHATAAILARAMLPAGTPLRVVTTLHGTDTTLLGKDPGYGPAIRHALSQSDAVTAVSDFLRQETVRLLGVTRPIEVIPNFFTPKAPRRDRAAVRGELGVAADECLILHLSNLRRVKRIDLLLAAVARVRPREGFKLVILAGGDFSPFEAEVRRHGLEGHVVVRERVAEVEDYLNAADLGLFTSESESFCLGVLETMSFGVPSVSTAVGGVPEVMEAGVSGRLVPYGDVDGLAAAVRDLVRDGERRRTMGEAGRRRAAEHFSRDQVVGRYEALYRRLAESVWAGTAGAG